MDLKKSATGYGNYQFNATDDKTYYDFSVFTERQNLGQKERQTRKLRKQGLGRVIFSTDAKDLDAEPNANDIEFEDFDKSLGTLEDRSQSSVGTLKNSNNELETFIKLLEAYETPEKSD